MVRNLGGCFASSDVSGAVNVLPYSSWTGAVNTNWDEPGNWTCGAIPSGSTDIVILSGAVNMPDVGDASGISTIMANCNNAIIESDIRIAIHPNSMLTIYGDVEMNRNPSILIKSNANGTGSLITNGSITGAGTARIERYVTRNQWHYISSPVAGALSSVFRNAWLKSFTEATNLWNIPTISNAVPLNIGQGFAVWDTTTGNKTFTYNGVPNTGDISPVVSYDGLGYNLTGNPYPSSILWDYPSWTKTNIDATAYAWNGYNYVTWNGYAGLLTGGIIPAGQGFFVHANSAGPVLTIPNDSRTHSNVAFYKSLTADLLKLTVTGNAYNDAAFINFRQDATEGFDVAYDASKLWGIYEAPQLYTVTNNLNYAVNVLPEFTGQYTVPMVL